MAVSDIHQDNGTHWFEEVQPSEDTYRLILITYGKCVYWMDNEKMILEKGDLLLIPCYIPYYGKSVPTMIHTKYVIHFERLKRQNTLPILQEQKPILLRLGCYELVHERMKSLFAQWNEQSPYYELMVEALLAEILVYVNREWDRGPITSDKHNNVDSMKQYIQGHYREKVTKEELGDVIKKTPNYAATLFKSVTNQTISEYVHLQRMKRAMYMLTESKLTVGEISEFLGYQDVSYFYRVFKRTLGKSPSELMQERSTVE